MRLRIPLFIILAGCILYPLFLIVYGHCNRLAGVDVAVVFGNKVNTDGTLSNRLQARLDKSIALFKEGYFPRIIVSGGTGREGFDEARVMKKYLTAMGIPDEAIIEDNNGVNTYKTAIFTRDYTRKNGLRSVMVITQYFHIFRANLIMKKTGIADVYNAYADFYEPLDALSTVRECFAVIKYALAY